MRYRYDLFPQNGENSFLDKKTKQRFERNVKYLLLKLNIKGEEEREVSLESCLLIAVGMATFLIGRPEWKLPLPDEIVVLPGDRIVKDLKNGKGKVELAALSSRETLYLTKKNLAHSFYRFSDGYNNIFHEIAHYFDAEDRSIDGTPSFQRFLSEHKENAYEYKLQWKNALNNEFEKLRRGELQLRPDAVKNIGEFFACATELFFEDPKKLIIMSKELYSLSQSFYNFDPLELLQTGN
ncbi:MAG: hypothetical protein GTO45_16085 [Candidatus Aminicenantes bacterium]|nr:hypothetical protein [Candidatus Aminicenantes bacterium]NIM80298.1 hypothetical protein [Candidatus Aminicenantes bacterium]NIN19645.1 hypothetical protein [Candidatus Aminicenantes bacterium]NIN43527.1 hypothetical protein [Candidatus Aminicenantes bacterium]NIN86272.1 hypothetical protein [Candidatus Aminicenantes bacterium]